MLLLVEKRIRGGIYQAIHRYAKPNNKYMNNHNKNIISPFLMYLDANNLCGWAMIQKLPVDGFKWVEDLSQFDESFMMKTVTRDILLKQMLNIQKNLFNSHKDFRFSPERKKLGKAEKLVCSTEDKKNILLT